MNPLVGGGARWRGRSLEGALIRGNTVYTKDMELLLPTKIMNHFDRPNYKGKLLLFAINGYRHIESLELKSNVPIYGM